MKTHRFLILLLAASLIAGVTTSVLGQAEGVKKRAKDLKKKVEEDSAGKTNAPDGKPKK